MKNKITLLTIILLLSSCVTFDSFIEDQKKSLRDCIIDLEQCRTGKAYKYRDGYVRCVREDELKHLKEAGILE